MADEPNNRENNPVQTEESAPHEDPNRKAPGPNRRDPAGQGAGAAPQAPENQPGSVEESTAGKATRPGPSPSEEGWPGRDTGAGEEGFRSSTDKDAQENPKPGLGGSQGTREG
ncbi:hypothetical protein [Caenispirillum salinarum]|uniref:hypothetical protein n=1 Tax=Caenispirillum salinarum TaxID=859058 RepID=UPI00384A6E14